MAPKKKIERPKQVYEEWPKGNSKGRALMDYPKYVAYCNYVLGKWKINDIDKNWDIFVADDDRRRDWQGRDARFRIEVNMWW